ncbi:hypothetical protein HDU98_006090 [Podochytrium sp. JEL0797]|nr:hypothetical protein HDU98_006090 [Podochytrium sp. JEL0797]
MDFVLIMTAALDRKNSISSPTATAADTATPISDRSSNQLEGRSFATSPTHFGFSNLMWTRDGKEMKKGMQRVGESEVCDSLFDCL